MEKVPKFYIARHSVYIEKLETQITERIEKLVETAMVDATELKSSTIPGW